MRSDVFEADLLQRGRRGCQGHSADDVWTSGLEPVWRRRPLHVVERHVRDRAAAGEHRLGVVQHRRRRDERPGAEWRVHLVTGDGDAVDAHGDHVDGPVRRQLRCIHGDQRAVLVCQPRDLADGQHLAGDVAGAGDGDDPHRPAAIVQRPLHRHEQGVGVRRRVEVHHLGQTAPRQHVRVVLQPGAQHHLLGPKRDTAREQVDRLRRVSDEDDFIC